MPSTIDALFGIELPIIQAPMAGAQGSAMAAAVSAAGGLGSLPAAMLTTEGLRREIGELRARTDRPFNVNFFCHEPPSFDAARDAAWRARLAPYYDELGVARDAEPSGPAREPFSAEMASVIEELRPPVVSFHFGLPEESLLERVRRTGAKILSSATTVEEARWLAERGVDAVIAQGVEAGGHRGMFLTGDMTTQLGTFALLPQIVDAVRVPVIAAGGIADARGVAAAFDLGAAGVQAGTAYLLCPESTISPVYRAALQSEAAAHTAVTNVITGRPARGIVNRIIRELGPLRDDLPPFPLATPTVMPLRAAAEARGSGDFSPLWSGQNASHCRPVPAAEVTRELAKGWLRRS
ncbi:MAG TPA: nitronate monooxygenase [Thermoanaerobaculia bacterium]|nr:nitronate monooxygenase [Thermoanaerobaculia bacterium]